MVLQDIEEKALHNININLPFYYRYVDDLIMAAPIEHTSNKKYLIVFTTEYNSQ